MKTELRCEYISGDQLGWTDGYRWWPELDAIFPPSLGARMTIDLNANKDTK